MTDREPDVAPWNGSPAKDSALEAFLGPSDSSPKTSSPVLQSGIESRERRSSNSVMRTIVSTGNDPLNILFQAAEDHDDGFYDGASSSNLIESRSREPQNASHPSPYGTPGFMASPQKIGARQSVASNVSISLIAPDVLRVWNGHQFVKMGWFSAEEAVTYVDSFFRNLSPLSPILSEHYSHHSNHSLLIAQEPMLCATILMISSRYHTLSGIGSTSRAYFVHQQLWRYCQQLIQQVILAQRNGPKDALRTLGTIESFLLMSEWHPQAVSLPPEHYKWDSDLQLTNTEHPGSAPPNEAFSTSKKWLEGVIEPIKRFDDMSWMLLCVAQSLGHMIGVFNDDEEEEELGSEAQAVSSNQTRLRRLRVRRLLCIYITLLAARLGCKSMIPISFNDKLIGRLHTPTPTRLESSCQSGIIAWIELIKLAKTGSTLLFHSKLGTRQLLRTGSYVELLEHFQPLLVAWRQRHLDTCSYESPFQDLLFIEYRHVKMYTNSLAIQAVVERALFDACQNEDAPYSVDDVDHAFIEEVVSSACEILHKATALAETNGLRFHPIRTFLRVIGASVFLLKAIGLGTRNAQLQSSFDLLRCTVKALRSCAVDDVHPAVPYATLLERHIVRLQHRFVVSSKDAALDRSATMTISGDRAGTYTAGRVPALSTAAATGHAPEQRVPGTNGNVGPDDWLFLPADLSMAPFGWDGMQDTSDNGLDFLWDLPL